MIKMNIQVNIHRKGQLTIEGRTFFSEKYDECVVGVSSYPWDDYWYETYHAARTYILMRDL